MALASTAAELMRHPAAAVGAEPRGCDGYRLVLGELSLIAPPGTIAGRSLAWSRAARRGAPEWR